MDKQALGVEIDPLPLLTYGIRVLRKLCQELSLSLFNTQKIISGQNGRLVVNNGDTFRRLLYKNTRIGRGRLGNDIAILNRNYTTSRKHILINIDTSRTDPIEYIYTLRVLSKKENTWLNNKPLVQGDSAVLNHGDKIKLGDFTFIFKTDEIPEEEKPPVVLA